METGSLGPGHSPGQPNDREPATQILWAAVSLPVKWDGGTRTDRWSHGDFSRVKIVWFISHNNKRDATEHQLILCALVREGYGREKSKFVFLLLFFLLFHYCHGPSSFTVRYLFYYLNFCISAMCIHLLKAALTRDAFKILLRF